MMSWNGITPAWGSGGISRNQRNASNGISNQAAGNAYTAYYQRLMDQARADAASSAARTIGNDRPTVVATNGSTVGNNRPTVVGTNGPGISGGTTAGNTVGSDRPTVTAPNNGDVAAGSPSDSMPASDPFNMYGRQYSPADLEKMFTNPELFATAWLDSRGMNTPTMLANLDDIYAVLPDLAMLANGTDIALNEDLTLNDAIQPAETAALFQGILEDYTTPGGSLPDPSALWSQILSQGSMDPNDPANVNWIQLATQWNAANGNPYTLAEQVANTNRLLLASAAGASPKMRSLVAGLVQWLGMQYQNAALDSNMPGEEKPWYGEWIAQNAGSEFM